MRGFAAVLMGAVLFAAAAGLCADWHSGCAAGAVDAWRLLGHSPQSIGGCRERF